MKLLHNGSLMQHPHKQGTTFEGGLPPSSLPENKRLYKINNVFPCSASSR
jgi:hypothetical protein